MNTLYMITQYLLKVYSGFRGQSPNPNPYPELK